MDNDHKLNGISFNCKHFKDNGAKFYFINSFSDMFDFVFLQEHWLYEAESDKLAKIGGESGMVAKSAMDENIERKGGPLEVVPSYGDHQYRP